MDCSVLIVDDDAFFRRMLIKAMSTFGVEFTICVDGPECLEVVDSEVFDYDLILMDLHMPAMLGSEATTVIRNMAQNPLQWVPIIAMTGDLAWCDQERCEKAGFSGFLMKPSCSTVLYDLVSKSLPLWLTPPHRDLAVSA